MAEPRSAPTRPYLHALAWLAVVVTVLVVLAVAQTTTGRRALQAVGVSPPDTPYTELSFDAVGRLPSTLPDGVDSPLRVDFVLGNGTGDLADVGWQVTVAGGATGQPVTGRVSLLPGQSQEQSATATIRCTGGPASIQVQVSTQPDPIRHLIDCAPAAPAPTSRRTR